MVSPGFTSSADSRVDPFSGLSQILEVFQSPWLRASSQLQSQQWLIESHIVSSRYWLSCLRLSLTRTLGLLWANMDNIWWAHFKVCWSTTLTHYAALNFYHVTYSQILRVRTWMSLEGHCSVSTKFLLIFLCAPCYKMCSPHIYLAVFKMSCLLLVFSILIIMCTYIYVVWNYLIS